jgi:hypothetical protein
MPTKKVAITARADRARTILLSRTTFLSGVWPAAWDLRPRTSRTIDHAKNANDTMATLLSIC